MMQAELQTNGLKTKRKLHANLGIDMTPMVDLGFLLITFFIFTTTMSKPKATNLIMPADGEATGFPETKALTVLLGDHNQVVAYEGRWEDALQNNKLIVTNYHTYEGIGKLVRAKQQWLQLNDKKDGRKGLMLVIKPTTKASYKNVIDALDETIINDVKKYAIVEPTIDEKTYVDKMK